MTTERNTPPSPLTLASRALAASRSAATPDERAAHLRAAREALETARGALYRLDTRIRVAERAAALEVTQ